MEKMGKKFKTYEILDRRNLGLKISQFRVRKTKEIKKRQILNT